LATRKNIVPSILEIPHVPKNKKPYEDYFGHSIRSGNAVRIGFSSKDVSLPFHTEDAAMWNFFEAQLKQCLSDLEFEANTTQRVKSALLEMLPIGESTIEKAAHHLGMSKRTSQRQLNKESSSYKIVLNSTRKALAEYYLERSMIPPPEISILLGYQDSNSFLRAFKSWTGITPGEYRSKHFKIKELKIK